MGRVKIRKNDDLLGLDSVEVIGSSGEKLGVMTPVDALRLAREHSLDLVEVNPKAKPPVCKILDLARFTYEKAKEAALHRRGPAPIVFLVRSKLVVQGRPGAFLVGDLVAGDAIRAGAVAHIPGGPDVLHAVPIVSVEFVDHVAEKTSELGLHVVGENRRTGGGDRRPRRGAPHRGHGPYGVIAPRSCADSQRTLHAQRSVTTLLPRPAYRSVPNRRSLSRSPRITECATCRPSARHRRRFRVSVDRNGWRPRRDLNARPSV